MEAIPKRPPNDSTRCKRLQNGSPERARATRLREQSGQR